MVNPATTAAIGFGFSAIGWLISPVLSRFLNQCFDELGIDLPPEFQSKKQILLAKLEKLQTTLLPQLLILTDAAHQSPHRPFLEKWIQKLKSSFYEAEQVLGLVEYERLETKVNSLFPSFTSYNLLEQVREKIQKHLLCSPQDNSGIQNLKNLEKQIEESLPKRSSDREYLIKSIEKLEEIVTEGLMEFVGILTLPSRSDNNLPSRPNEQHTETISTPCPMVIGRDKDRDDIVKLLRENSPESTSTAPCYSVIGIWGMGGSGKTTLAQYVCDYEKEAMYFDLVIWAHVSLKFSVHTIWKLIWESAFKEACPTFSSLEGLQSKLEEKLRGQMFFLVLDDVWCDKGVSEKELEQLFAPLRAGQKGSKILVTTRIEEAAKALDAMNPIPLRELDEDQFFSLFMRNALGNTQIRDNRLNDKLTLIGKEIAARLHRSPLAAKTVTGQLRRRPDADFWSSMLDRSLLNDTMGALFLSYQHLPYPLQRCFAFCSLFPKGHEFDHDHLVNLWIAEGFIETEDTNEHIMDIANQYFLELISSSFIQVHKEISDLYSMHDLIHDLARHVSQGECFEIDSVEHKEIPTQTRHLYVVAHLLGEYVEKICKLKNLRTILVFPRFFTCLNEVDLDALFINSRKLYVVDLQHIESLPKSVTQLKNLRYLSILEMKKGDSIPESINKLYQLRVLRIRKGILLIRQSQIEIPDVGRLILIQDLREFHVRKRKGFELKQLEHLTNLFGSLSIYDLHNVERKEEANQVKLSKKKGLQNLGFYWDHEREDVLRDSDVEILDGLCPPPKIKELVINGYGGKELPNWFLGNDDCLIQLKHLELVGCRGLEALPGINKLSDLISLTISLPRLKSWVPLPLNLARFKISHCLSLSFALKEDLEMIMSVKSIQISQIVTFSNFRCSYHLSVVHHFERVQEMIKLGNHINEQALSTISNDLTGCIEKNIELICQLKVIYGNLYLPRALEMLSIVSCFITDRVLAGSLQGLNFLTHLTLDDMITITCITNEVLSSLTCLKDLRIQSCLFLTSIGGWDTHSTLEQLQVEWCPNLTLKASVVTNSSNTLELPLASCRKTSSCTLKYLSLGQCMPSDDCFHSLVSLEKLHVRDCLTIVNPHINYLKSIGVLDFYDCPNLVSLRGLCELNYLKELHIFGCQKLKCDSDVDKLPGLKNLFINRFCQLEQLISIDGFSSLISLTLSHAEEEPCSQQECEVFRYLSSLETICFRYCKMRVLPNLRGLHTVRSVDIDGCENLTSIPELPPSVQSISIIGCNEDLTKGCRDPKNPNWQKISHIPRKSIKVSTWSSD